MKYKTSGMVLQKTQVSCKSPVSLRSLLYVNVTHSTVFSPALRGNLWKCHRDKTLAGWVAAGQSGVKRH